MLFLLVAFLVLVVAISLAPQRLTQLALAAFWCLLVVGCTASVLHDIMRSAGGP